jgi:hypothetical protein
MGAFLCTVGSIGIIVCLILLIVNAVRKKPVKKVLIGLGVCFAVFVVGFIIIPDTDTTIAEGSKITKGDLEILDKKFDDLTDDERTRLITMQSDMTVKEMEKYKDNFKRLYIEEMGEHYSSKEKAAEIFEEDFDFEIRKKKGLLTEEEQAEQKAREEQAEKFAQDVAYKMDIEEAIVGIVGEKTNTEKPSIVDLKINDNLATETESDKLVIAELNASDNLTVNMIKAGILKDSVDLFESLFGISGVSEVNLSWYLTLVDSYGNEKDGVVLKIILDKKTADKINWENFDRSKFSNVAIHYWEHPTLSK